MDHFKRIQKECFWDLSMDSKEIQGILEGHDFRKKMFLFEKILINSTRLFEDLRLFKRNELSKLLDKYTIPLFNGDYIFRRKNLAEVYFFDKPLLIDELKWII